MVPSILFSFAGLFLALHLATLAIAYRRCRPAAVSGSDETSPPPVTLVRPLCGVEAFSLETLNASFALEHPSLDLIFCVARENDPIIPMVRAAIAAHPSVPARLLIGDDAFSMNPKLNNMVTGWRAARHERLIFIDSNVLVPPDAIGRLLATWRPDTGVVSAPPVGCRPDGFGAHLECAFLNTFQARWQYAGDTCGFGFAQGKTLFYRKSDLDRSQLRDLADEPAEDAATTKMVWRLGLRVRLGPPSSQPLGMRPIADVWGRQLRWARLRRVTFLLAFLPEIVSGTMVPTLLIVSAAFAAGWLVAPVVFVYLATWYAAEVALAFSCGWPVAWQTLPAMLFRDVMMPLVWIGAFMGRSFTWQGTAMRVAKPRRPKSEPIGLQPEDRMS